MRYMNTLRFFVFADKLPVPMLCRFPAPDAIVKLLSERSQTQTESIAFPSSLPLFAYSAELPELLHTRATENSLFEREVVTMRALNSKTGRELQIWS